MNRLMQRKLINYRVTSFMINVNFVKKIVTSLIKVGTVGKREVHREVLTEFKHRDRLCNVEQGCAQNINKIETQRGHLRMIESFDEI